MSRPVGYGAGRTGSLYRRRQTRHSAQCSECSWSYPARATNTKGNVAHSAKNHTRNKGHAVEVVTQTVITYGGES